MVFKKRKLSLLDTLISLPIDPSGMMRHLLKVRRFPPYLILAPLAAILVIVAPAAWYNFTVLNSPIRFDILGSVALSVILTTLFFSFFFSVLLRLLFLQVGAVKVLAATIYAAIGLVPFTLAFYFGNLLTANSIYPALACLATGRMQGGGWFVSLFPYFLRIALVFVFLIFAFGIKALTNIKGLSAIVISLFAVPVMIGSFVASLTVADALFSNTGVEVYNFFIGFYTSGRR